MIKSKKVFLVNTDALREYLIAQGSEEETARYLLLVANMTVDCLDDLFHKYFNTIEDGLSDPELGVPHYYVEGIALGTALYMKFLPKLFPEISEGKIREIFNYSDFVEVTPFAPEETSSGDKPS